MTIRLHYPNPCTYSFLKRTQMNELLKSSPKYQWPIDIAGESKPEALFWAIKVILGLVIDFLQISGLLTYNIKKLELSYGNFILCKIR